MFQVHCLGASLYRPSGPLCLTLTMRAPILFAFLLMVACLTASFHLVPLFSKRRVASGTFQTQTSPLNSRITKLEIRSRRRQLQSSPDQEDVATTTEPEDTDVSSSTAMDNFDGPGFARYLAPYALALTVSILVTGSFFKFVLLGDI
jgi:hypothetical protein